MRTDRIPENSRDASFLPSSLDSAPGSLPHCVQLVTHVYNSLFLGHNSPTGNMTLGEWSGRRGWLPRADRYFPKPKSSVEPVPSSGCKHHSIPRAPHLLKEPITTRNLQRQINITPRKVSELGRRQGKLCRMRRPADPTRRHAGGTRLPRGGVSDLTPIKDVHGLCAKRYP